MPRPCNPTCLCQTPASPNTPVLAINRNSRTWHAPAVSPDMPVPVISRNSKTLHTSAVSPNMPMPDNSHDSITWHAPIVSPDTPVSGNHGHGTVVVRHHRNWLIRIFLSFSWFLLNFLIYYKLFWLVVTFSCFLFYLNLGYDSCKKFFFINNSLFHLT